VPTAYYRRLDAERFQPTVHAQGAWNDHEQHMAPVSGLWPTRSSGTRRARSS
jgi:hypothetical protein